MCTWKNRHADPLAREKGGKYPELFQSWKLIWHIGSERKSLYGYRILLNRGLGSTTLQKAELPLLLPSCTALNSPSPNAAQLLDFTQKLQSACSWPVSPNHLSSPHPRPKGVHLSHPGSSCVVVSVGIMKATSHVVNFFPAWCTQQIPAASATFREALTEDVLWVCGYTRLASLQWGTAFPSLKERRI